MLFQLNCHNFFSLKPMYTLYLHYEKETRNNYENILSVLRQEKCVVYIIVSSVM